MIRDTMLRESRLMRGANFEAIGTDDLARLFRLYDENFFAGWLAPAVVQKSASPLFFRLGSTMTRAGGKTIRSYFRRPDGTEGLFYEIAIASRLLFMTFGNIGRPVVVCGLVCADRLAALQRIMEHEMIHLTEMLVWDASSCKAARFSMLASRIFGHRAATHDLVTPRERAAVQHGIRVGDLVQFDFEGQVYTGRVNRIHQRATVLVESPNGTRYTDGKHYSKFYIPLSALRLAAT